MQAPLETGPAGWSISGWLGLVAYAVIFVLLLAAVAWLARPRTPEEVDSDPPSNPR